MALQQLLPAPAWTVGNLLCTAPCFVHGHPVPNDNQKQQQLCHLVPSGSISDGCVEEQVQAREDASRLRRKHEAPHRRQTSSNISRVLGHQAGMPIGQSCSTTQASHVPNIQNGLQPAEEYASTCSRSRSRRREPRYLAPGHPLSSEKGLGSNIGIGAGQQGAGDVVWPLHTSVVHNSIFGLRYSSSVSSSRSSSTSSSVSCSSSSGSCSDAAGSSLGETPPRLSLLTDSNPHPNCLSSLPDIVSTDNEACSSGPASTSSVQIDLTNMNDLVATSIAEPHVTISLFRCA
jgi:hypothetical protein